MRDSRRDGALIFMENQQILKWTQDEAIKLCTMVEKVCPIYGCHVALTGGSLYKDLDLLFYRIRQYGNIRAAELFINLRAIGFGEFVGQGWVVKTTFNGKPVDCFFPEELKETFGGGFIPRSGGSTY